jgi:DNA primase
LQCPFHEDDKPSLRVYPDTNTYHCFGCSKSGDVIQFIQDKEQCSKHEALKKASKMAGEQIIQTIQAKPSMQTNYAKLFAQMQKHLSRSKKAIAYLEARGLHDAKIAQGYNPGTEYKQLKNCIVYPLKDENGTIVSLYGRSIGKAGTHFYTANRSGLYPGYLPTETRTVILTESIIDSATIAKYLPAGAGTDYQTLALYGTNGFTDEHSQALSQLPSMREIILFFDGDEAGEKAAEKYSKQLKELLPGVQISKVATPENEDPNSLTQSHEPEILNHLIENRTVFSSPDSYRDENNSVEDLSADRHEKKPAKPDPVKFSPNEVTSQIHSNGTPSKLDTSNSDYLTFTKIPLLISILGGIGLHPIDKMRVTLKIERTPGVGQAASPLHQLRHSLDLYHDDQVEKLIRKTAERLELGSREVQLAIAELTAALETHRLELIEKNKPRKAEKREIPPERAQRARKLMERKHYLKNDLYELIKQSGVVGERNNSLTLWITYATRKRYDPLHVICLGASGTGKTYLQEKITDLVPEEDKVSGTAISENALYYAQDLNLSHKLFIIEDLDGASNILYALRELQTKKTISKMVTQKDSKGNMRTEIVTVHGPICLTATTTKERLYEDNANRCLLIYLDGSRAQQEAIMDDQRKRSAGKINKKEQEQTKELLRDMQALYKPITVRNPYAEQLKIPETVFKPLRTNSHYLAFIEGVTFCNQFQRKAFTDPETGELYINTEIEDIELANELMKDVLLSKSDELSKACRDFFESLKSHLQKQKKISFYREDVRHWMRVNPNNLRYYLKQLVQYGLLKVVQRHKNLGNEYEVSNLEEYQDLNGQLSSVLDKALEEIKKKNNPDS